MAHTQLKFEAGQHVTYQGKRAKVINPNFAGKGTIEIKPFGKEETVIVHDFELGPSQEETTPEEAKTHGKPVKKTDSPGEGTIPANVQGQEEKAPK